MRHIFFSVFFLITFLVSSYAQEDNTKTLTETLNKAEAAYNNKNYKSSLDVYLNVGEKIVNQSITDNLRLYVRSQIGAARCYSEMKCYAEATNVVAPLLKLDLTETEKNNVVDLYYQNGTLYAEELCAEDANRTLEACSIYEQMLPYVKGKQLEKVKQNLQKKYIIGVTIFSGKIDFLRALEYAFKARDIYDGDAEKAHVNYLIGSIYENICDIENAIYYYDIARTEAIRTGDDKSLHDALVYERNLVKDLDDVEKYTLLGVTLDSLMSHTKDIKLLSNYYDYVGNEYVDKGNYDVAELYFNNCKDIINQIKEEENKIGLKIKYLSNMRDLKRKQNDYESAIRFSNELATCYSSFIDNSNFVHYITYLIDTQLYSEIKDSVNFERVADSLRYAFDIAPDAFNKSLIYNFIGTGYSKLGNGEKALYHYAIADSILSTNFDESNDLRLTLLQLKAGELKKIGRTAEACKEYKKYLDLIAGIYGTKSSKYSNALTFYANSLRVNGEMEESAIFYTESMDVIEGILKQKLRTIPSSDRELYISAISQRLWMMSTFALTYRDIDPVFVKRCFNASVMLKSLLFESDRSMYNTLQLKGTKEDVADYLKMSSLRMQQKTLMKNYRNNKNKVDSIRIQIRNIDNKLTEKSKIYSEYTSFLNFKYEDVRSYLKKGDVLFDFIDFEEKGKHYYAAFVVRKDLENPLIIKVFEESQVDEVLKGEDITSLYKMENSDASLSIFWKALEKYAKKGAKVYYVPTGIFYQVSLESLPLADGSMLGEHYTFERLTSSLRISDPDRYVEGNKKAVLYGGLQYDMDISEMQKSSSKFDHSKLYTMRSMARGGNKFNYLPETLLETETISTILKKNGYDVTVYTEGEGTEESFLSMHNNSPQILHVATHGFYYTPEEASSNMFLKGSKDAMLLSGLVFSGGNAAWLGKQLPKGVLGGIISAGNISCLDLSNINLVVLSACQSGQGKVTREGLFGLQRAFKKAGVQTIVMTLWDVSDVVTKEFMVEFYNNLFSSRKTNADKKKAFEKARKTIRKKYPEPFYWAGFVMVD